MEEQFSSTTSPLVSERSAEALRELHRRAQAALAAQRSQVESLEQQINSQLDSIHQELERQIEEAYESGDQGEAEAEALPAQLGETEESWQIQLQTLEEQVRQGEERIREQQAALEERGEQLADREQCVEQLKQEIENRNSENADTWSQVESQELQLEERERNLEQRASEFVNKQQVLDERTEQLDRQEEDISRLRDEYEQHKRLLDARESSEQTELDNLRQQRGELEGKVAHLEAELATAQDGSQQPNTELQSTLTELEKGFKEKEKNWKEEIAALQAERDKLTQALNSVAERLDASRNASSERDELQQKFDLALADMQRLRERASELEQELAQRPEPQEDESAELVHLRDERDALAERVATLESQAADSTAGENDQQFSDLQRRFELAVEDVRQLKSENSELTTQLASMEQARGSDTAAGGQDWEAQKQRLLASLEGGPDTAESREERASVESTIRITDEVVAQKDREISELRDQLEAEEQAPSSDQEYGEDPKISEALDADEIIQLHRDRLAKMEEELREKLRTTEMELSLERAKIAREQTELAEWRIELEALRESIDCDSTAPPGQPKRRWLSKLGLGGDDDD